MTLKLKVRIVTDAVMTAALIVLMGYMVTGDLAHEIVGTVMIALWILHHVLNLKWFGAFGKSDYPPNRIMGTVITLLLLLSLGGLIVSSIMLSSYLFSFLGIERGMGFARVLHMVTSYWCFVLTSLHLGLHWSRMMKIIRKKTGAGPSAVRTVLLRVVGISFAVYGVYALIKQQIVSYLFMRMLFVFFDFEQPLYSFFFDYIAMMILFATVSYYVSFPFKKSSFLRRRIWSVQRQK